MIRRGQLNTVKFIDNDVVQKIGMVAEVGRPARLQIEAWALQRAREKGVNVPRVIDYYVDDDGREVIFLERIHGKLLSGYNTRDIKKYLRIVGEQMAILNNITDGYGWINHFQMKGKFNCWKSFITTLLMVYGTRLVESGIIEKDHLRIVFSFFESIEFGIIEPYLVNRDIKLSNTLIDKSGKVWILDWEDVILGDRLYDLAIFGLKYGRGFFWKSLYSGYGINILPSYYTLYEIVGLIGIVDFRFKQGRNYIGRQKKLIRLISSLQI